MSSVLFNPKTQYIEYRTYTLKSGKTITKSYIHNKKTNSGTSGRPTTLPNVDKKNLKQLRQLGLSWNKIAEHLNISAYHAKKIYDSDISDISEID